VQNISTTGFNKKIHLAFRIIFIIFVLMKGSDVYSSEMIQVQHISEKTQQIALLFESALVQNKKMTEQAQLLKVQINEKNAEINELKTKYNTIQFSRNIELTSQDVQETKKTVNRMLRDIDNCIALIQR